MQTLYTYIRKHKNIFLSILGCLLFISGMLFSSLLDKAKHHSKYDLYTLNNKYTFINPLLSCNEIDNIPEQYAKKLREVLTEKIAHYKNIGYITDASVYFRDLNNGPWVGINEKTEFIPGSLLKVPLLISAFKYNEDLDNLLDKKIVYAGGSIENHQDFKPQQSIKQGNTYSGAELMEYMIRYSDNNAAQLLSQMLPQSEIVDTYKTLGLTVPTDNIDYLKMRTKDYASFFRVLYNATYLGKNSSESALALLSSTDFNQGLTKGIPENITVAHKFGERTTGQIKQLHDCGIIYYPKHPYILCVMTRGYNSYQLASIISEISQLVYRNISNL